MQINEKALFLFERISFEWYFFGITQSGTNHIFNIYLNSYATPFT